MKWHSIFNFAIPILLSLVTGTKLNGELIAGEADIIIIGAGVSGIATALTLLDNGIEDFIIIEGRDEVGGRVQTEGLTNPNSGQTTYIEIGANWIEGRNAEEIQRLAEKWELKTVEERSVDSNIKYFEGNWGVNPAETSRPRGSYVKTDAENTVLTEALKEIFDFAHYRRKYNLVDMTLRAGLRMVNWLPTTPIEKLLEWFAVDYMLAESPDTCSLLHTFSKSQYKPFADDSKVRLVVDQRGYKYIFENELKEKFNGTLNDPRLRLNTIIRKVDYSGNETILTTENDEKFIARKHVVSTMSIGVLQDQFLTWDPVLPNWKREAISAFYMTYYQKIHLLFDRQFWGDEAHVGYADPDVRGRYPLWKNLNAPGYFNGSETGYIFFVTQTEDEAIRVSHMDKEDIKAEILHKLRELYGDDVPEPLDMTVPLWNHDPLFRGSYSNWPIGFSDQHHWNLRQPISDGKVIFTGEAYSRESLGFIQGAWAEGKKTGQVISRCILQDVCPRSQAYERIYDHHPLKDNVMDSSQNDAPSLHQQANFR